MKIDKIQIVNVNNDQVPCDVCGSNLIDVSNFQFEKRGDIKPTYFEEFCLCKNCNSQFILHYDIFDENGHVLSRVFVEDVNDENYNWQDSLNFEQKKAISDHLPKCPICLDRLSQEVLSDAWLRDYIDELRNKLK